MVNHNITEMQFEYPAKFKFGIFGQYVTLYKQINNNHDKVKQDKINTPTL